MSVEKFYNNNKNLVIFPMLVLVKLVECLRVLKESVYQSIHQENGFLVQCLLGYGVYKCN
jgi:hypothetical protein